MSLKDLKSFFYNTKTGYSGINKLFQGFTDKYPYTKLKIKDVNKWYSSQEY